MLSSVDKFGCTAAGKEKRSRLGCALRYVRVTLRYVIQALRYVTL